MEQETTIEIGEIFEILRKRIKMIILITLAAALISGLVSFLLIKPTYEATVSVVIGKTGTDSTDKSQFSNNDVTMYQNLMKTYNVIATSKSVAKIAEEKLKDDTLKAENIMKLINVTQQANTQILLLKVQDKEPQKATNIVNAVTEAFTEQSKITFPTGDIKILDKAEVPQRPIKPNKTINIAIAFFLGLMASVGLAFLLEYMDNTMKTENDVEKYLELPVIGLIPKNLN